MEVACEASLTSGSSALTPLDGDMVCDIVGGALRVTHVPSGAQSLAPMLGPGECEAHPILAVSSQPSLNLLAATTGSTNACVYVFRYPGGSSPGDVAASLGGEPLLRRVPAAPDMVLSAVAVSSDGSRVAAFGATAEHSFSVWDGEGAELVGVEPHALPLGAVASHASFCPWNRQALVAGGARGLFFIRLQRSHEYTEAAVVPAGALPAPGGPPSRPAAVLAAALGRCGALLPADAHVAAMQLAPVGFLPSTGEVGAPAEAPLDGVRALVEARLAAAAADARCGGGLGADARAAAAAAVADGRGENSWLAAAWVDEGTVVACNAAGQVAVFAGGASAPLPAPAPGALTPAPARPAGAQFGAALRAVSAAELLGTSDGGEPIVATHLAPLCSAAGAPAFALLVGFSTGALAVLAWPSLGVVSVTSAGGGSAVTSVCAAPGAAWGYAATAGGAVVPVALPPPPPAGESEGAAAGVGEAEGAAAPPAPTPPPALQLHAGGVTHAVALAGTRVGGGRSAMVTVGGGVGDVRLWRWGAGGVCAPVAALAAPPASRAPSARVTAVAAHRRLPLLAAGCEDGSVFFLSVSGLGSGGAEGVHALFSERVHAAAVTALAWDDATPSPAPPLLASVSAGAATAAFHGVGKELWVAAGRSSSSSSSSVRAFARLPLGGGSAVTAAAWLPEGSDGGGDGGARALLLGTASGHLLSLLASLPVAGAGAADVGASLRVRARLLRPVLSVGCTRGGAGCALPCIFLTLAGEKAVMVMPLPGARGGGVPLLCEPLPLDAAGALEVAAFDALGAEWQKSNGALISNINAHKRAARTLAVCPGADFSGAALLASGGDDGAVTLLAVASACGGGGGEEGGGAEGAFTVAVDAVGSYSPYHVAGVTGLCWDVPPPPAPTFGGGDVTAKSAAFGGEDGGAPPAAAAPSAILSSSFIDGAAFSLAVRGEVFCAYVAAGGAAEAACAGRGALEAEAAEAAAGRAALAAADAAAAAEAAAAAASLPPALWPPAPPRAPPTVAPLGGAAAPAPPAPGAAPPLTTSVQAEALLAEVERFKADLGTLLAANEAADPLERLERAEFALDEARVASITREFDGHEAARRGAYAAEVEALESALARVKEAAWNPLSTAPGAVFRLGAHASVANFPLRRRTPAAQRAMDRLATLRAVEMAAVAGDKEGEVVGAARGSGAAPAVTWVSLASRLPPEADWLLGAGLLPYTVDPVAQQEGLPGVKAALAAAAAAKGEGGGGARGREGGEGGAGAGGEGAAAGAAEGGEGREGGAGDAAKTVDWEGPAVVPLLYHPASVRTPLQKRTQVALLGELARAVAARYNGAWEELRSAKMDALKAIAARHARMRAIFEELKVPVTHSKGKDVQAAAFRAATLPGALSSAVLLALGADAGGGGGGGGGAGSPLAASPLTSAAGDAASPAATEDGSPHVPSSGATGAPRIGGFSGTLSALSAPTAEGVTPIGPVERGGVVALFDPFLAPSEEPASVLVVSDELEVGLSPYVSPAELARRAAEEERRLREANANKDDAPQRALMDMMSGTLAAKDEITALREALVKQPWMDAVPEEKWNIEQREVMADRATKEAALTELLERNRLELNAELTRIGNELKDIVAGACVATGSARARARASESPPSLPQQTPPHPRSPVFDEKVVALKKRRALVTSSLQALALYRTRLSLSILERESHVKAIAALSASMESLVAQEEAALAAHDDFNAHVAKHRAEMEELTAADKALDKGFRATISAHITDELSLPLPAPAILKTLVALFKKRAPARGAASERANLAAAYGAPSAEEEAAELAAMAAYREGALQPLAEKDMPEGCAPAARRPAYPPPIPRATA
jgi:hypothetical protein